MPPRDESPAHIPPRWWLGSELGARVASAIVLGIVFLLATYVGGWPFALLWLVAGVAVLFEWTAMARVEPRSVAVTALGISLMALTAVYLGTESWSASGVVLLAGVALALALGASRRDRLWAAAGFAYAAILVLVPPLIRDDPALGLVGILWMYAVVWATDIAAYFTGRRLGGPKLWPRVSPKKTWSGFIGGLVAGVAAGVAVAVAATLWGWTAPVGLATIVLISAFASAVSQLGDLAESAMKRYFDVKDSSHLIPGHGGVMDRLDGFWAVALLGGLLFAGTGLGN
jgi:phosphatidate cytidylyltransferase